MRDLVSSPAMGVSTLEPEVWCGRENSSGSARSMEATDASRLGVSSWFRIKNFTTKLPLTYQEYSLTHSRGTPSLGGGRAGARETPVRSICEQSDCPCLLVRLGSLCFCVNKRPPSARKFSPESRPPYGYPSPESTITYSAHDSALRRAAGCLSVSSGDLVQPT